VIFCGRARATSAHLATTHGTNTNALLICAGQQYGGGGRETAVIAVVFRQTHTHELSQEGREGGSTRAIPPRAGIQDSRSGDDESSTRGVGQGAGRGKKQLQREARRPFFESPCRHEPASQSVHKSARASSSARDREVEGSRWNVRDFRCVRDGESNLGIRRSRTNSRAGTKTKVPGGTANYESSAKLSATGSRTSENGLEYELENGLSEGLTISTPKLPKPTLSPTWPRNSARNSERWRAAPSGELSPRGRRRRRSRRCAGWWGTRPRSRRRRRSPSTRRREPEVRPQGTPSRRTRRASPSQRGTPTGRCRSSF
jgi:hypothetical protein